MNLEMYKYVFSSLETIAQYLPSLGLGSGVHDVSKLEVDDYSSDSSTALWWP